MPREEWELLKELFKDFKDDFRDRLKELHDDNREEHKDIRALIDAMSKQPVTSENDAFKFWAKIVGAAIVAGGSTGGIAQLLGG